jgi:hypothetical protein
MEKLPQLLQNISLKATKPTNEVEKVKNSDSSQSISNSLNENSATNTTLLSSLPSTHFENPHTPAP